LAEAVTATPPKADVAKMALRHLYSVGRSDEEIVSALRKAAGIQSMPRPPGSFASVGSTSFSSRVGRLAGNHFLTIIDEGGRLAEVGRRVLWEGAQPLRFQLAD